MYSRDYKEAFENAKSKGLKDPENYMYMYSIVVNFINNLKPELSTLQRGNIES
jgi:hypothetical protein